MLVCHGVRYDSLLKKIYPTIALSGLGEKVQVLVKKDAPNPLAEAEKTLAKTAPLRIQYSESPYLLASLDSSSLSISVCRSVL